VKYRSVVDRHVFMHEIGIAVSYGNPLNGKFSDAFSLIKSYVVGRTSINRYLNLTEVTGALKKEMKPQETQY
jgi:hypothetical protein